MKHWSGFAWPDADKDSALGITYDATMFMSRFLAHVPERNLAVQAGGNVGVYPLALARVFGTVHTFEPEAENWNCLLYNMERCSVPGLVVPYNAALGSKVGTCGLVQRRPDNTGTFAPWGAGAVPVTTIDDLALNECDLIWLDIEGYEVKALRGAEQTISRHRPVVIVEDNGLTAEDENTGAAIEWLRQRDYRKVIKLGNDALFAPDKA